MYTIKSQKDNVLLSITVLVLITASARLVAVLYLMTELEAPGSTLVLVILYGIVLLGSIFLLLRLVRTRKHKLTLQANDCVYMPLFGTPRNLSYSDLDRIDMGGKTYILYGKDGKKLVTFDDFHMENAHEIIAFLKQKGVRTQI
ncbi:hypothetical protein [Acetatifactor aquisgranensis]|uniref:hypothetical protein n=1 Tax=Acetatifactor aquisgranensis TaxID=2941233 RepID=UPI00203FA6CC|nr:hypothetical protein [Acetatifactor aquisgranensis]MCI8542608.1 hypothetical protein [Lachnospiraceae bacterium]